MWIDYLSLKAKLEKIKSAKEHPKKANANKFEFLTIIKRYTAEPRIPKLERNTKKLKSTNIMKRH